MKLLTAPILLRILCVLLPVSAFSQVVVTYCNNTAMVPVFKQDFGRGSSSTSTSKAIPGSTNYNFGNVGTDGNYIITPFVQNANKFDWALGGDHTGDPNGNMFLVNAGGSNSIFFQQKVPGLCAGSNYNFTAWIANVNSSTTNGVCGAGLVYPKIKFNIKDTFNVLLATYTTVLIPLSPVNGPLNWQKYGFQFAMPSYTGELKLEIIDAWGGGAACGNDVAIDDILFEACVPKITVALTSNNDNVCIGGNANLQSTLINNPYTNPAYLWQKSVDGGTNWSNIDTPGVGKTSFSIVNAVPADGGLFRVQVAPTILSVINATCSAVSNGVAFTVNPLPKLSPTSNAPICSGNDLLLKANASLGSGVYSNYKWTGPQSFQSFKSDTTITSVKTNASGIYSLKVTDSKGCADSTSILINIDSTPVLTIQSLTDTICIAGQSKISMKSSLLSSKFYWNNSIITGNLTGNINATNPDLTGSFASNISNNGTSNGKIKYSVYALSSSNCKSNTIDTFVTIIPAPTIPNAGTDINICAGSSVALNANIPAVGTGTWKQIAGPNIASFADSAKANTTVANLMPGKYLFTWTIANNCASNTDTVEVNYTPKPSPAFSVLDTVVCGPASIVFTNNTSNKNNYSYAWDFGNGLSSTLANPLPVNYSTSVSGLDTVYTVTLKAFSNCDTVTYFGTIRVKRKVSSQLTITPKGNCAPLLVELKNSSVGNISSIKLLFGDGTDTLINNNSIIQHSYFSSTDKTFTPALIVTNNCGVDTIKGVVFVKANLLSINNNLTDTAVCGLPFTLNINNATTGATQFGFNWGDSSAIVNSTNAGLFQHVYTKPGTFTLSHTINNSCGDTTISKKIIITPLPSLPNAGTDINICAGSSVALNANIPTVGVGTWKQIAGPNTAYFADSSKANTTVANLIPGNYLFIWTIANKCASNTDTVALNYTPKPSPTFSVLDTVVCGPASIVFTNTTPNKNNYTYAWNFGNGLSSSLANPLPVNYSASVTGLDTVYTVTLKAFSNCDTLTYVGSIRVKRKVSSQLTITPKGTCAPLLVELKNSSVGNISSIKLLFGDGTDTLINNNSIIQHSYFSSTDKTFTPALIVTNNCGVDTIKGVVFVKANLLSINNNLTDTAVCGLPFTLNINNATTGATQFGFNWGDSSAIVNSTNAGLFQHVYTKPGTFTLSHTINNSCGDTTISKKIIITPLPSLPNAGTDINICAGSSVALNANIPTVGVGTWKQIAGPNTAYFADSSKANTTVANLIPGNYLFTWTIANNCASNTDTVILNYTPKPLPAFSVIDTVVCGPATISFTNNTPNKNNYTYAWDFGNGTSSTLANPLPVNYAASVTGLDTVYTVTLKAFTNCDTLTFVGSIKVKRKAVAQFDVSPKNTCLPLTVTFNNQSIGINTIYTIQFGDGKDSIIQNNNSFNYTYYGNKTQLFQPLLIATNSCGTDTAFATVQAIANQLKLNTSIRDTAVCGIPFTYSVNNNSTGASTYEWNWGDGTNTITSSATNQQHQYTQAGVYKVSHQIKNICGDTTVSKMIQLYTSVKATIEAIPNNLCIGDSLLFKSFVDSSANYQWKINDSIYSRLPAFGVPFNVEGTYKAQLIIAKTNPGKTCSDSTDANFAIVKTKAGKAKINPLNGNCIPFNLQLINQSHPGSTTTWEMGNGNIIKGDTASYTFSKPGSFNIKMIAKNAGGCEFIDSATINIKSPFGNIDFKSGLYCNTNNLVQFKPSLINTDLIEYDFGDGTTITTNTNPIQHQYSKPGIYFPTFTLISNNGCKVPLPKKDSIIIEKVKAGFSVKTIFNCGITSFNFSDSSESSSGINQYQWKLNKSIIANSKNTSIDFKQTGTQETNLMVTSNWGCTDSISGAYNVSIYSFPQVNINSINEACLNNLMELKSEISSIDSIIYRIWNLGNGSKASDSTVRILYFDEGKYTVKLTAATINKCYDSALKQITIHPVPTIKIASTNKVCSGDSLILKADGATNYVWKDQQENIICNNCLTLKVRPQRSTEYKVIGYNEFGCTQIAATNVQVIDKPKIIVSPESVICEGSSIRISASGASTYQWLPANGITNYTSPTPIVSPQITTTYKVLAKDAYNCFTDTGFVKVIVGKPTPIKIGKDSSLVAGSIIKLKATALQNNITRWRWSGGTDLSCITCEDPTAKIINDQSIICTATNSYGCISSDTIRFKTFCPNTEVFIPNAFTPDGDGVNDQFYVQSRGISNVKSMRIYSRWGELVFEKYNAMPNDKSSGWDGKVRGILANPDVYVYICEVVCEKGAIQLLKGNIAIIK